MNAEKLVKDAHKQIEKGETPQIILDLSMAWLPFSGIAQVEHAPLLAAYEAGRQSVTKES